VVLHVWIWANDVQNLGLGVLEEKNRAVAGDESSSGKDAVNKWLDEITGEKDAVQTALNGGSKSIGKRKGIQEVNDG
jgi:hypothetical protein